MTARLPSHSTVSGAITSVDREDWLAVSMISLHLVGFSKSATAAMKYSLDSLDDNLLRKPQQIILLSPMIGITAFARFAGLAELPSKFPAFTKSAWLGIVPKFNHFKYNSFPRKGGAAILFSYPGAAAADYIGCLQS